MIEVFTTNIRDQVQADGILKLLGNSFPELDINFELDVTPTIPYPCGHTILRVEGAKIETENIISLVHKSGFMCDVLEDKVCKK